MKPDILSSFFFSPRELQWYQTLVGDQQNWWGGESVRQEEPGTSCPVWFQKYLIDCRGARKKKRMRFCSTTRIREDWIERWMSKWSQECTAIFFSYHETKEVKLMNSCGNPGFEFRTGCTGWRNQAVQTSDQLQRQKIEQAVLPRTLLRLVGRWGNCLAYLRGNLGQIRWFWWVRLRSD